MFNKLFIALVVAAAAMFVSADQASADHGCYSGYGGHNHYHRPSVSFHSYSPSYSSAYRSYRVPSRKYVPSRSYFGPGYGYSPRSSYFGGYGYGSPFYGGGSYFGAGRGGISIGIGF